MLRQFYYITGKEVRAQKGMGSTHESIESILRILLYVKSFTDEAVRATHAAAAAVESRCVHEIRWAQGGRGYIVRKGNG